MAIHIINLVVLVLIPMVAIHVKGTAFSLSMLLDIFLLNYTLMIVFKIIVGATSVCFIYSVLFLKLWSYIQVNMWCRTKSRENKSKNRMRRQSLSYSNLSKCNVQRATELLINASVKRINLTYIFFFNIMHHAW